MAVVQDSLQKVVHNIRRYPEKRLALLRSLPPAEQSFVILRLSQYLQHDILTRLSQRELVQILNQFDPDDATDMLQILPKHTQQGIVKALDQRISKDVEALLPFDPKTAAGLMNLDYIKVEYDLPIDHIIREFKTHETRTGKPPIIVVTHRGKVTGYLPSHQLGFVRSSPQVEEFTTPLLTVLDTASTHEVIDLFRQHPHNKVAVIGKAGEVLGIIYSDDVLHLLDAQKSSLYNFAGVHEDEEVQDSARRKVSLRYRWLIINLGTAFVAAMTVGLFDEVIGRYILLAAYMPIVAGMGGNAATQTLAVMVRGIALRQIDIATAWPVLKNEVFAGVINGFIIGVIVAGVVLVFNRDWKIAIILASATLINLVVAATFGTVVPLIMKALGKDPAESATIFITTATDVLGFLVFLGLATLVLA